LSSNKSFFRNKTAVRANQLLHRSLALALSFTAITRAHPQVDWPHSQPQAQQIDSTAPQSLFATLSADPHKDIKGVRFITHRLAHCESAPSLIL
jgi:hypothetical protein